MCIGGICVNETVKQGSKNQENISMIQDVTETKKEETKIETVKSEKIRYENADSIYK